MIPTSVIVIPLFMILKTFNMLDSPFSIVLVSLTLPFLIYLFRQNTILFPVELIKAARIDGLSEFAIYLRVYLPNMKAVFVTASLILFIGTWNSLLYPLVIIQSQKNMTLPVYLNSIGSSITSNYGAFMIALLISTLPILVIFVIAQKYFRAGMKMM
jgi:lactose/L-arabinose transport system permease protein